MKLRNGAIALALLAVACGSPLENTSSELIEQVRLGDPLAEETYAENRELLESEEALPIWMDALENHQSPQVRQWAARMLGNIGDPEAIPALAAAMSQGRDVRDAAVTAIKQFPEEQAVEAFVMVLSEGNREAKSVALTQVSRLGADEAIPAVAAVAAEGAGILSETATNTLGDLGSDEAAAALATLILDDSLSDETRESAIINLGRVDSEGAAEHVEIVISGLEEEGAEDLLARAREQLG